MPSAAAEFTAQAGNELAAGEQAAAYATARTNDGRQLREHCGLYAAALESANLETVGRECRLRLELDLWLELDLLLRLELLELLLLRELDHLLLLLWEPNWKIEECL